MKNERYNKGFTLIEMIVSIGLFVTVLFIATSAFLSILNADRASSATRTTMDNLNVAMEDMTRLLKTGTNYSCGESLGVGDCLSGGNSLSFRDQEGVQVTYSLDRNTGTIQRSVNGSKVNVTAPEINIEKLNFIVRGSAVGGTTETDPIDGDQSHVVIQIAGKMKTGKVDAPFSIQTMVTQRAYDL